jgi:histidyl-tRNA synthetase
MIINHDIYYRYEREINNGTLYIYNMKTQKIVKSNYITYRILQLLEEDKNGKEVIDDICKEYENYTKEEVMSYVEQIVSYLHDFMVINYSWEELYRF